MKKIFSLICIMFSFIMLPGCIDGNYPSDDKYIEVNEISLNNTYLEMNVGDYEVLEVTVRPFNATDKIITWQSLDESIVKVNNGIVEALNVGKTVVVAKSTNNVIVTCEVVVYENEIKKVESLLLNKSILELEEGDTDFLRVTISPSDAHYKLIWENNNPEVAIVENGYIEALKEGITIVTVKTDNGISQNCIIVVRKKECKYTIDFNTDGGSFVSNQEVIAYSKIEKPIDPVKEGYKFLGWYNENKLWDFKTDIVTSNLTLSAKWEKVYDLTNISFNDKEYIYDGLEKELTIDGSIPSELIINYSTNKLTNVGETIAIATLIDSTGKIVKEYQAILKIGKATYDMTNIQFNSKIVTYNTESHSIWIEGNLPEGVYVEYAGNEVSDAGTYTITAKFKGDFNNYNEIEDMNATLNIEQAEPILFPTYDDINFNLSSELKINANSNVEGTISLDSNQVLVIGNNFYNWTFIPKNLNYKTVTGKIQIIVKAKVTFINYDNSVIKTLYVDKGEFIELFKPTYDKEADYIYVFNYWQQNGQQFDFNAPIIEDLNLYANYTKTKIYDIKYNLDGGEVDTILNEKYTVNDSFYLPIPYKTGYSFIGWVGTDIVEPTLNVKVEHHTEDKEYTAIYLANNYIVTLDSNGGENLEDMVVTYDSIPSYPIPELFGYEFLGWYYNDELINDKWVIANNITLVAKWQLLNAKEIYTIEDLKNIEKDLTANYLLMNDIELDSSNWTPIASKSANKFSGIFDGNGYKISNLTIEDVTSNAGLFGYSSGIVKNLTITDANIKTEGSAGILVVISSGQVINCHVSGQVESTENDRYTGGLIGYAGENSKVINCSANVIVIGKKYVGGLIGYSISSESNDRNVIEGSYAIGTVSASNTELYNSASSYVGGLIGYIDYVDIANCYANNSVKSYSNCSNTSTNAYAGGLIGYMNESNINQCYATGEVSSEAMADSPYSYAGGLVGLSGSGTIIQTYSTGLVTSKASQRSSNYIGSSYAGGLIGYISETAIKESYSISSVESTTTYSTSNSYAGGLVGYVNVLVNGCNVNNSFATGDVKKAKNGNRFVLITSDKNLTIENSYYDSASILDCTNVIPSTSATGILLNNFKLKSFIINTLQWDSSVWTFVDGEYPTLDI